MNFVLMYSRVLPKPT